MSGRERDDRPVCIGRVKLLARVGRWHFAWHARRLGRSRVWVGWPTVGRSMGGTLRKRR